MASEGALLELKTAIEPGDTSTPVTPHDTTELAPMRQLYVGTGGTIVGQLRNDSENRSFLNVPDGAVLDYDFKIIHTDTDADDMIAIR